MKNVFNLLVKCGFRILDIILYILITLWTK